MAEQIWSAIRKLLARWGELALRDEGVRSSLRELGEALLALTAPSAPASPPAEMAAEALVNGEPAAAPLSETAAAASPGVAEINGSTSAPSPPRDPPATAEEIATLFRRPPEEPTDADAGYDAGVPFAAITDADLPLIAKRCRLKAETTRWRLQRRKLIAENANFQTEIQPRDLDLIGQAKALPECFLWMCLPEVGATVSDAGYEELAGTLEAVARAAEMLEHFVQLSDPPRDLTESALQAAAEAQSALRVAAVNFDNKFDFDQQRMFAWIQNVTKRRSVYIRRYMRLDTPAKPSDWHAMLARIEEIDQIILQLKQREKRRREGLNRIDYHLKRAREEGTDNLDQWRRLVEVVAELVNDGLPASNVELRDRLLPVVEDIPLELEPPEAFRRVLREIDRYLETKADFEPTTPTEGDHPDVRRVRELLRGKAVVLIGGERRQFSAEALKSAFGLSELIWIAAREHSSYTQFESDVARPETAVVLLAIRWSSHSFGEVKNYCDRFGKPLVRLPGGYNPKSVAYQILQQAGRQLSETPVVASV